MNSLKDISNKKYKIVFCDIFDTIVYRTVEPEFTKKIWANRIVNRLNLNISMIELYKYRNKVETELGEFAHNNGNDWEFRYDDMLIKVYKYLKKNVKLGISREKFKEMSTEIEVEIESSVQKINEDTIKAIKSAHKKGQKVYCISDMFLSKQMIESIFDNLGISNLFDGIFVSCEYLKNKKSGELYKIALSKLNVEPSECIMIGDNKLSDYEIPKSLGIDSVLLNRSTQYQKYEQFLEERKNINVYDEFLKLTKTPNNQFEHAVFTLYKFVEKLYYNLRNEGFEEVFFLSREGEYLKKLFDDYNEKICGKKIISHYILVSRKATYLPSLRKLEQEDFNVLLKQYLNTSINEFLGSLNFTKEEIMKILDSFQEDCKGLKPGKMKKNDAKALNAIKNGDFDYKVIYLYGSVILKMLKNNKEFKNIYEKNREEQNTLFKKYIKQYTNKKRICVVDVGWNGSIQDNIQKILGGGYQVRGYLYGLISRDPNKCLDKEGLIFTNVPTNSKNFDLYAENRTIYEIILGASHGSANRYKEDNNKVIVTTFEKQEEKDIYKNIVSKIQKNMFTVFNRMEELFENEFYDNLRINKSINQAHFKMLFNPTSAQLQFFNKIYHYENFGVFEFSKFNLKHKLTIKFHIKENLKFFLKSRSFFNDTFWPTLKLYNERLYVPRFLYKTYKKLKLKKKGIL